MLEYYLFAGFVFALVLVAILFNDRLRRSRAGQDESVRQRETRMFALYQNLEDLVNSIEDFVQESRREISSDKAEITSVLAQMKALKAELESDLLSEARAAQNGAADMASGPQQGPRPAPDACDTAEAAQPADTQPQPSAKPAGARERGRTSKAQRVFALRDKGYEPEDIAQELGLSRGEVALILGLNGHSAN